jgi:serine/threonine protein kinase
MPTERAISIVRQMLAGLAHAHERGITHRLVKPENVVVMQMAGLGDQVRILDFGVAKLRDGAPNMTAGTIVGTPSYMAPEQIRGDAVDAIRRILRSFTFPPVDSPSCLVVSPGPAGMDTGRLVPPPVDQPPFVRPTWIFGACSAVCEFVLANPLPPGQSQQERHNTGALRRRAPLPITCGSARGRRAGAPQAYRSRITKRMASFAQCSQYP